MWVFAVDWSVQQWAADHSNAVAADAAPISESVTAFPIGTAKSRDIEQTGRLRRAQGRKLSPSPKF